MVYDLRTRTALVCGALALAIAASVLLRSRSRRGHLAFSAFAGTIGLWYLSQAFYGFFLASIWQRFTGILAVLLPQFALSLFDAMVPDETGRWAKLRRYGWFSALPFVVLLLTPLHEAPGVRVGVFLYAFLLITLALWELGQRGARSPSRAIQRRVRFLVVIGALAGSASILDFLWFVGAQTPPVGAVLSVVFLFALSQSIRQERLLDLSEMLGRLLVAAAVAFLIAFIFYLLLTVIGTFNTMYLNAVLAATVVLVVFEPLQARVEEQIRKLMFRERLDFERALVDLRRRLVHTLEVSDMGPLVVAALERSRRVTAAGVYLRDADGAGFDQIAALGAQTPARIDLVTVRVLLERLESSSLALEEVERELRERRAREQRWEMGEAMLTAAEVLGSLRSGVLVAIRDESREIIGLLGVADERVKDAFGPEEVSLLEQLATQMAVVVENSMSYAQMKERDRLALLGQMAAGLAHEIRNPLGAIKGAAQLLAEPVPGAPSEPASQEFIGIILEEVDRLDRVVGSVLDLAHRGERPVLPIDVNSVVRRTAQIVSTELRDEGVELLVLLEPELPRAAIDPEQLRQVLLNLVRNAFQAVGDRGKVTLSTRVRFGRTTRSDRRIDEPFVEIHVADTGPGISRKVLDKIFLPFFTTKDKGTGLGLAISQRIVQGAQGRIEVRSYEGRGSTFTVVLPAAKDAPPVPTEVAEGMSSTDSTLARRSSPPARRDAS